MFEEYNFKVGDKVTVFNGAGSWSNGPSVVRTIKSITAKRGDITLDNYITTFSKNGSSKGESVWNRSRIEPWRLEHSEILKMKNMRYVISSVDFKTISDEDAQKIYNILNPYYEKKKAEEKLKTEKEK